MKNADNTICQSCGMPMHKITDFGTYDDGSVHADYCHFCFKEGRFTDAGISLEEKMVKNVALVTKMGMPQKEAANLAQNTLPKLKRWRKQEDNRADEN